VQILLCKKFDPKTLESENLPDQRASLRVHTYIFRHAFK
jgi:hypothetical protein